jgi:hypothetical protein
MTTHRTSLMNNWEGNQRISKIKYAPISTNFKDNNEHPMGVRLRTLGTLHAQPVSLHFLHHFLGLNLLEDIEGLVKEYTRSLSIVTTVA